MRYLNILSMRELKIDEVYLACKNSADNKDFYSAHYMSIYLNCVRYHNIMRKNKDLSGFSYRVATEPYDGCHEISDSDKKQMIKMYDQMKNKVPADLGYRSFLKDCADGKCAYCGVNPASSLDHFLPKEVFPFFSNFHMNLLPCCLDCNSSGQKGTYVPSDFFSVLIHPYYDDFLQLENWLGCEFSFTGGYMISNFYVKDDCGLGEHSISRLEKTMDILKLGLVYANDFDSSLNGDIVEIEEKYDLFGEGAVSKFLFNKHLSFCRNKTGSGINCWKSVAYLELSKNDYFCNGGFNDINRFKT